MRPPCSRCHALRPPWPRRLRRPPRPPPPRRPRPPRPRPPRPDPVVAKVGDEIRLSDLSDAAQALPDELRSMPPQMLYPMLLDQLVDRRRW